MTQNMVIFPACRMIKLDYRDKYGAGLGRNPSNCDGNTPYCCRFIILKVALNYFLKVFLSPVNFGNLSYHTIFLHPFHCLMLLLCFGHIATCGRQRRDSKK